MITSERITNGAQQPPYDAKGTANVLLDWAEHDSVPITPLKIQKILFFCHADYLVTTSKPFLKEGFEAWSYGPVIPSVFQEFKEFSRNPITTRAKRFDPIRRIRDIATASFSREDGEHLRRSYALYSRVPAGVLSAWTHQPNGPWEAALKSFAEHSNINRAISDDLILKHHRSDA